RREAGVGDLKPDQDLRAPIPMVHPHDEVSGYLVLYLELLSRIVRQRHRLTAFGIRRWGMIRKPREAKGRGLGAERTLVVPLLCRPAVIIEVWSRNVRGAAERDPEACGG